MMMNTNIHKKKASDFQLLSLQGRDKECLVSLFNDHKATQQQQDATCYLVFKQHIPHFYSLKKYRVGADEFTCQQSEERKRFSFHSLMDDCAIEEVDVDFPLALYRTSNRHHIFNLLLSYKERYEHYAFNIRLPIGELASERELEDIVKLCLVAGADNLTIPSDENSDAQQKGYIPQVLKLMKRLFVTESCGMICTGLSTIPAMERIVALAKEELGEEWVDRTFLKFEC